ncbi:hypothetical protein NDU88_000084 [Pleurodeles waltl]|uniref:Uncharacterized protein n=1 Tax=Pleurodeles waltl TaxID=8319 RepID=A0AAV7TEF8_PLEWA|nr:hypothetical protein NDU88_000084 [Pleurodeles waltl]
MEEGGTRFTARWAAGETWSAGLAETWEAPLSGWRSGLRVNRSQGPGSCGLQGLAKGSCGVLRRGLCCLGTLPTPLTGWSTGLKWSPGPEVRTGSRGLGRRRVEDLKERNPVALAPYLHKTSNGPLGAHHRRG